MADFNYDELADSVGSSTGNFFKNVANSVADYTCQLYHDYPGAFIGFIDIPVLSDFGEGLWNTLCAPRSPGLPPLPVPPFTGGQCPVVYILNYGWNYQNFAGTQTFSSQLYIWGAISLVRFVSLPNEQFPDRFQWCIEINCRGQTSPGSGNPAGPQQIVRQCVIQNANYPLSDPRVTNKYVTVVREDGQPDTCGDPPAIYPPPPSGAIPSSAIVPVLMPGRNISVNIPIILPPKLDLSVPLVFEIQADFNLNLNFDFSGATFNFNFGNRGGDPNKPPSQDYFENYYYPPSPDLDPSLDDTENPVTGNPIPKEDIDGLRWIKIVLSEFPDKAQFSTDDKTCYFAGWIAFTKGADVLPRQQINFARSLFRAPDGSDGYQVVFTNGATGVVTEFTEKPEGG